MPICFEIPGWRSFRAEHLVLDLNGTISVDGEILAGISERLAALSASLTIHVVTADTLGRAAEITEKLGVHLVHIDAGNESGQKRMFIEHLGAERVIAIGNGANDATMLTSACLGIAVLGTEGLATSALHAADVVVLRIDDALDLLLCPKRLVATLRR